MVLAPTAPKLSLTPEQIDIVIDPSRIKTLVATRRWGKSTMDGQYLFYEAYNNAGTESWFVSPTYTKSIAQMRMMETCPEFMQYVKAAPAQFPPRFELWNGSTIAFRSADRPKNLRGWGLRLIIMDEAAYMPSTIWDEVLVPMLVDFRGSLLLNSTFNGRNWFYKLYEQGLNDPKGIRKSWLYPAETAICFRGPEGRKEMEIQQSLVRPSVWQQEFLCKVTVGQDCLFNPDDIDLCIKGDVGLRLDSQFNVLKDPQPDRAYVIGLDVGRKRDYAFASVWDSTEEKKPRQVMEYQFPKKTPYPDIASKAQEMSQLYNNCLVIVDSTGMEGHDARAGDRDSTYEFFRERIKFISRFTWEPKQKRNIIDHLALQLQQHNLQIPGDCTETISQLKLYQKKFGENALYPQYGSFGGEHDDAVQALAMAVWAIYQHQVPRPNVSSTDRLF